VRVRLEDEDDVNVVDGVALGAARERSGRDDAADLVLGTERVAEQVAATSAFPDLGGVGVGDLVQIGEGLGDVHRWRS